MRPLGRNITKTQFSFLKFFYVSSGGNFSKVKGTFSIMLRLFWKVMEKKQKTAEEEAVLRGFTHPTDYVDRKHTEPIVAYAREWKVDHAR